MFQQEEYFKEYPIYIPTTILDEIIVFCNEVLNVLAQHKIEKFTLVLDSSDRIEVGIKNDTNRIVLKTIDFETIFGQIKIDISCISEVDYSLITIVYLKSNERGLIIVNQLKLMMSTYLPTNYSIRENSGSLYLIVSKNFIGQLWNIHSDPLDAKAHIVLTDCEEYFVWYPKNKTKYAKRMNAHKLYILDVFTDHTVFIKNYFNNLRVHIVGDLDYGKKQSN